MEEARPSGAVARPGLQRGLAKPSERGLRRRGSADQLTACGRGCISFQARGWGVLQLGWVFLRMILRMSSLWKMTTSPFMWRTPSCQRRRARPRGTSALLIASARQGAGVDESWTDVAHVRDAVSPRCTTATTSVTSASISAIRGCFRLRRQADPTQAHAARLGRGHGTCQVSCWQGAVRRLALHPLRTRRVRSDRAG